LNIHLIVVAYGLADDLLNLFQAANAPNITWHLFLHSEIESVVQVCGQIAQHSNVQYYPYKRNRGLSRSWNDGLWYAYRDFTEPNVAIIANDDILPEPDAVQILAEAALSNRRRFKIDGIMLDRRTNTLVPSQYGLTAINPIALNMIGFFDENIFPIYWEDVDYNRRAALAGLEMLTVPEVKMVHGGSKTSVSVPGMVEYLSRFFNLNHEYYIRKWGGTVGQERYDEPFNEMGWGLRIGLCDRNAPYPGHNRTDQDLVVK
jgi:GT2 family glycosyltransferase